MAMSWARPHRLIRELREPTASVVREMAAEKVPKFHAANPNINNKSRANTGASRCDNAAAYD